MRQTFAELRAVAAGPTIIALDHELGGIQRCEGLVSSLPTISKAHDMDTATLVERCHTIGREIRSLGVDIEQVARIGSAFVSGFEAAGLATTPKHFPGHRNLRTHPMTDTTAVVPLSKPPVDHDLQPFRAAFKAGVRCAMIGPSTYPALGDNRPALLSQ